MSDPILLERDRFRSLFDQQVRHTWETCEPLTPEQWNVVPVDSDANYLGVRVNRITVAALLRHICLVESSWFEALPRLSEGEAMPPPGGMDALDGIPGGRELLAAYRELHERGLANVAAYDESTLRRSFSFVGRRFTVAGFLWAAYGHHCYHLGQIDLLMRQQNVMPPEFLELPEQQRVIA